MTLEVAQGGGVSVAPGKEMLVNAQNARTASPAAFRKLAQQKIVEPAFHRSAADGLPLAQTAAADAVPVFHKHAPPERFGGSFSRLNAWEALPKRASARLTVEFPALQPQYRMSQSPTLMP